MSLNKSGLKNEILQIMKDMRTRTKNADEEFAERLTDAIDNYVKSATIIYEGGLAAPNGPVTGMFNGKLE
ncbi:hypothetical protein HX004_14000 [Myroides sp. 1354]|nr:hypothetical protein [Myroides sp. R163-1]MDM1056877.1 hypothetical protein [Myroides sp. 1354]MDM1070072.1 hypothetical protein [Myroides sp. 1372]